MDNLTAQQAPGMASGNSDQNQTNSGPNPVPSGMDPNMTGGTGLPNNSNLQTPSMGNPIQSENLTSSANAGSNIPVAPTNSNDSIQSPITSDPMAGQQGNPNPFANETIVPQSQEMGGENQVSNPMSDMQMGGIPTSSTSTLDGQNMDSGVQQPQPQPQPQQPQPQQLQQQESPQIQQPMNSMGGGMDMGMGMGMGAGATMGGGVMGSAMGGGMNDMGMQGGQGVGNQDLGGLPPTTPPPMKPQDPKSDRSKSKGGSKKKDDGGTPVIGKIIIVILLIMILGLLGFIGFQIIQGSQENSSGPVLNQPTTTPTPVITSTETDMIPTEIEDDPLLDDSIDLLIDEEENDDINDMDETGATLSPSASPTQVLGASDEIRTPDELMNEGMGTD